MIGKEKEQLLKLCGLAANERDPKKFMELVTEINRILEAKEQKLKASRSENDSDNDNSDNDNKETV
jgi:hypothetical protein